jgi:hypothetical protein
VALVTRGDFGVILNTGTQSIRGRRQDKFRTMLNHVQREHPQVRGLKIKETRQAIEISLAILFVALVTKFFSDQSAVVPQRDLIETRVGSHEICLYQNGTPTEGELSEGKYAFSHWKAASRKERRRYAEDLIQSGLLIGMLTGKFACPTTFEATGC